MRVFLDRADGRRYGPEIHHVEVDPLVATTAGVERLPRRSADLGRSRGREHQAQPVERHPIALVQRRRDGGRDELGKGGLTIVDCDDPDQQPAADVDSGELGVDPGDMPGPVDANLLEDLVGATASEDVADEPDYGSIRGRHGAIVSPMTMRMAMTSPFRAGGRSSDQRQAASDGWMEDQPSR